MKLQQIADYAMEYLDSKGVAAEYDISEYEFSDIFEFDLITFSDTNVVFGLYDRQDLSIDKNDAIAIAKHFSLTAEDLK